MNIALLTVIILHFTMFGILVMMLEYNKYKIRKKK